MPGNRHLNLQRLQKKFRYNIRQLITFEKDPSNIAQKSRTTVILLTGFLIYSLVNIYPCFHRGYIHGAMTNISLTVLFALLILHLRVFKSHVSTTILGAFALDALLFFHFITETDWTIGMDAFWLFILITPFITDYMAGVIYGSVAALGGLILSILCFRTGILSRLQPYGSNMVQWYPVIYVVVMAAAAVIEYELTAYQIDKKISDAKISFYQGESTRRLKKQLAIHENNEQTIRRYKHDIRHYNRVLAGFIQNKEYDRAASYLKEFDSMLESVTQVSFCENHIVNELLTIYASQCQKLGFRPRIKADVPEHIPMEQTDLTSLVANALENAVEALGNIDEKSRSLQVEITYDGRKLKLMTRNPISNKVEFGSNGLPLSTRSPQEEVRNAYSTTVLTSGEAKNAYSASFLTQGEESAITARPIQGGIGTAQIRDIAEKYGGVASFTEENNMFVVRAVMTCL